MSTTRNRGFVALGTVFAVTALSPVLANVGAAATWSEIGWKRWRDSLSY